MKKTITYGLRWFALASLLAVHTAWAASAVMDQALDGSSQEAFEQGMAEVKADGSEAEYSQLKSAIAHLLYYDLSVRKDKARLYRKLDGKTPAEIIAMVKR